MKVTVHTFRKVIGGYDYFKNNIRYHISIEIFECFKSQYKNMGWSIHDNDTVVSFSYIQESMEQFLKKLHD